MQTTCERLDLVDPTTTATVGYVEAATIFSPNGTPHIAQGAYVSPELIVAYAIDDPAPAGCRSYRGKLTTWSGEEIGTYAVVSRWERWTAYDRYTMTQIEATIDGKQWTGRYGSDWSQLVRLRPMKGGHA